MNQKKDKHPVKNILLFLVLVLLAGAGIRFFYIEKMNVVEVVPVSMLRDDWWKDYNMCKGTVTNRMSQEVLSPEGREMDALYVEQGQSVKAGDLLLSFDMEEEKIDMEMKKYKIKELELSLSRADEGQKQDLQRELKQLELEYESLKKRIEDATVAAAIDGVVKQIHPEGAKNGAPVLIVTSEDKLYVEGIVDEFTYFSVKEGALITAASWDTGKTFQARITEISPFPVEKSEQIKEESTNPNVSYYPFTAVIVGDAKNIEAGESVNVGFDGISSKLFLPLAYLRSEGSRSYVYIRGGRGRLEKCYVTTGQSLYNTVIEIKEGLENDDYVAFPYGKNIREGAATVISKEISDVVY